MSGRVAPASHGRPGRGGIELACGAPAGTRHVGVVFVHGIGSQREGDTLLDWGGTVVQALADARVRLGASADPVVDVQLAPGPDETRYIEVQLPALLDRDTPLPEQHWVLTEAWWANRVRPPAFARMAEWLGPRGAIRRILEALLVRPAGVHDPRLRPWVEPHPLRRTDAGSGGAATEEAAEPGAPMGMKRPPGNPVLRMIQSSGAALYLQAASAVLLVVYGALRSIEKLLPIGPLKDGALTRPIDSFVLDWFGDVYILLSDSAQAASVRDRLLDALIELERAGCEERVVVAHSGGAIVTAMALAGAHPVSGDPVTADPVRADRLITLGEGLNLAWRLTAGERGDRPDQAVASYQRLYRDVLALHPKLRWDDFWASQDPAPVGVLEFPAATATDAELRSRVRSHATWNQLSIAGDHGAYWDNDEEFVTPLLRLLEGRSDGDGLFGPDAADRTWSNLRRRRLSMLSMWRQLTLLAPMAALVVGVATGTTFALRAADAVLAVARSVPGADVVGSAVAAVRDLDLASHDPGRFAAEAGVWIIAAAVAGSALFALKAPPERSLPWATSPRGVWVGRVLGWLPWLFGAALVIALGAAALRFVGGSTAEAIDAGRGLGLLVGVIVGAAALSVFVFGAGGDEAGWGYAVDAARMIVAMVALGALLIAPVVAVLVFVDVARSVVGILTIVTMFAILGRLGSWRWSVWDERERAAMRARRGYPATGRVVAQMALLLATLVVLFLAVSLDSAELLAAAGGGVIVIALLGVSIDVLDAVRQDRRQPAAGLRRNRSFRA
jgi:hypothetical protein